jgi:16S rRNA (cytosine1402-N4)-methyltransferase
MSHIPVMLKEVLSFSKPVEGAIVVDCTFGAGGYARAFLEAGARQVIAIDRDPHVLDIASALALEFQERLEFHNIPNSQIKEAAKQRLVDVIVYDLGVSSMQIDEANRGFSFLQDGPLDMRMDGGKGALCAADIVNGYEEKELTNLIFEYGDERKSRLIARKICEYRQNKEFSSTKELADLISKTLGGHRGEIHPATRTFQALRIAVNSELQELRSSLQDSAEILKPGGKIVVVSFHSGEDKIVKNIFQQWSGKPTNTHYDAFAYLAPPTTQTITKFFAPLHKKVIVPSEHEVRNNIRARSAKLRAIQKIALQTDEIIKD